MKRLTFKTTAGAGVWDGEESVMPSDIHKAYPRRSEAIRRALDRLAEYENLGSVEDLRALVEASDVREAGGMTTQELIAKLREETRYSHKANLEVMDLCCEAVARLEQMEQAKAEGRLVELPCKLGDTVWVLRSPASPIEEWVLLHPSVSYTEGGGGVMRYVCSKRFHGFDRAPTICADYERKREAQTK